MFVCGFLGMIDFVLLSEYFWWCVLWSGLSFIYIQGIVSLAKHWQPGGFLHRYKMLSSAVISSQFIILFIETWYIL
jgi:hypothetical protein